MVQRTREELKPYTVSKHFGMCPLRYHGKEETGAEKFSVGVSSFLPGGGAEWDESSTQEKVYYVLQGEMTVTDKDGKKHVIHPHETISFQPHEGRSLLNETNLPAQMLVISSYT